MDTRTLAFICLGSMLALASACSDDDSSGDGDVSGDAIYTFDMGTEDTPGDTITEDTSDVATDTPESYVGEEVGEDAPADGSDVADTTEDSLEEVGDDGDTSDVVSDVDDASDATDTEDAALPEPVTLLSARYHEPP